MQKPDFTPDRRDDAAQDRESQREPVQRVVRRRIPVRMLVLRLILNCISIYVAVRLVDGVDLTTGWEWWHLILVGLVFGLLNAIVKPIVVFFSLPALILTMGLFYLIINALIFWMTPVLVPFLVVEGFWAAFRGSIVVSLVNWLLSWLLNLRS